MNKKNDDGVYVILAMVTIVVVALLFNLFYHAYKMNKIKYNCGDELKSVCEEYCSMFNWTFSEYDVKLDNSIFSHNHVLYCECVETHNYENILYKEIEHSVYFGYINESACLGGING